MLRIKPAKTKTAKTKTKTKPAKTALEFVTEVTEANKISDIAPQIRAAMAAHNYMSWSQAHVIILGEAVSFFRGNIPSITAYFDKAVPGGSAVICTSSGEQHPKVHAKHRAWLEKHGYAAFPTRKEVLKKK